MASVLITGFLTLGGVYLGIWISIILQTKERAIDAANTQIQTDKIIIANLWEICSGIDRLNYFIESVVYKRYSPTLIKENVWNSSNEYLAENIIDTKSFHKLSKIYYLLGTVNLHQKQAIITSGQPQMITYYTLGKNFAIDKIDEVIVLFFDLLENSDKYLKTPIIPTTTQIVWSKIRTFIVPVHGVGSPAWLFTDPSEVGKLFFEIGIEGMDQLGESG